MTRGRQRTIPVLALILALFRPEGVVIALGFVVVWFCLPMPPGRRCFGFWCLGCGAIAVGYFLWRYSYFGLWFPLPVYVKARIAEPGTYYHVPAFLRDVASVMTGLEWSLEWLTIRQSPLPALAVIALASAWSWSSHRREVMRSLVFLLPFTLLFASLLMVQQVQNVHWRFQAPITLVLFTALARAAAWVWAQERRGRSRTLLAIAILIVAVLPLGRGVRTLSSLQSATAGSYIDTFAPWLGAQLSRTDVIALTEAGKNSVLEQRTCGRRDRPQQCRVRALTALGSATCGPRSRYRDVAPWRDVGWGTAAERGAQACSRG